MTVTLFKHTVAHAYVCDFCDRPTIVAMTLPAAWEVLGGEDGQLLHRCSSCWFDALVADLEESS